MYSKFKNFFKQNLLTILTIVGVVLGVVVGLIVRATVNAPLTNREIMYINFIGDLFLRMLKALIIPLIVSSLVAAISSLDLTLSKKIGGYAIGYYLITTVLAVILGIILVTTVRPGVRSDAVTTYKFNNHRNITTTDTLLDLVRNMFPPNVIQACLQQYQTVLKQGNSQLNDIEKWKVSGEFYDGTNILGLVVVSVVIGITMSSLKDETLTLAKLFKETSGIMMKITSCVIWISPIGVFFLICSKILEIEDLQELFGKLGLYFVTVAGGILFHGFIILPIIYFFFTKNNPYKFITKMSQAMATAFGTASSSATLPVTITCLETKNGIDSRVSRFVLPIGATINMDGTALYEAVAAIFIAQLKEVPLSFGSIIAICITATAASIGAAGIPHAGLVTLVMVLDTVGLPAEDVSIIIAVDWLIDRIRTLVNVLGDSFGAGIVFHLNRNELDKIQPNTGPTHTSSLNLVLTPNNTIISSEML